jgi:exosortase A-associated hydrolase 2
VPEAAKAGAHAARPHAFFLETRGRGRRFALHHAAQGQAGRVPPRAAIVHAHAFGEEMNKSRRMAALQARAFARLGLDVLQVDLAGCGDSDLEWADIGWQDWVDDIAEAAAWLGSRVDAPLWLWGQRVGALVATAAAAQCGQLAGPLGLLFWQPVLQGRQAAQQFLRLKAAAAAIDDGGAKAAMAALRAQIDAGHCVEVAGYRLPPALLRGLEAATLEPPPAPPGPLLWLEVSPRDTPELLPASRPAVERWRQAGWQVQARAVGGPAFWQTTEIEDAPALVDASGHALAEALAERVVA